jgi:hypothetical protein
MGCLACLRQAKNGRAGQACRARRAHDHGISTGGQNNTQVFVHYSWSGPPSLADGQALPAGRPAKPPVRTESANLQAYLNALSPESRRMISRSTSSVSGPWVNR